MFGVLENLTRAAIGVVVSPVDMAADLLTMGGVLTDQEKPYTVQRAEDVMAALSKATKGG